MRERGTPNQIFEAAQSLTRADRAMSLMGPTFAGEPVELGADMV
ncbi:hypothetical protein AGR7C_Cc240021 [Agrobacterium deltaense Zutra 3/1]|uniref:Uncharacterized protein n=1 Tax=Agrobacterium deltaense Zutra 3/1 TaxID=1183427 RepID=A0A1S7Q1K9_9HYPH|nr:hypothetical protein AGR7C_Cc240021 [Agrobacterium deltaense Zutra 3/1]